jgi:acetyl-CoA C-acetyltransferase
MTVKGKAYIAGIFEHPTRLAPNKTVAQLHAEVALGALADAGLAREDVDGYFCSGDAPGPGPASMAEYMNLKLRHMDSTEIGGASYVALAAHAAEAIALGKCDVALVTLAGRPRSDGMATGTAPRPRDPNQPEAPWEAPYAITTVNGYAMCAMRHMYEYGTTTEQLAWVKVAASHHAQHNPHAMLPEVVTVEDVLNSPLIADPLHRLDCCVISDGGGAIVLVRPEIAKKLKRPLVKIIGVGEAVKHLTGGIFDLTTSGASRAGPIAFAEAGVTPAIHQRRRERSMPMACFGPATSLIWQIRASSLRRGSATRCGLVVSWSAPRKSRPLFKRSPAWPAYRSCPPPIAGVIRCRWHSFGPAPAQCCKKPRCVHLVCSNWHASKFRSGS